jgi:DNA-binding response OmpR family regulator
MHVLIIENHRDAVPGLFDFLETKGHVVDVAGIGFMGRHLEMTCHYDAILLNLAHAGTEEMALCRSLRERGRNTAPILMLSILDTLNEKIASLEAGADDFLAKPVSLSEIESRMRMLFRLGTRLKARADQVPSMIG